MQDQVLDLGLVPEDVGQASRGGDVAANAIAFSKYGARFLVRGGKSEGPEGKLRSRHVVLEFESYEKAVACYYSPEYQAAIKLRQPVSIGDIAIVEGYDGPQPG